MWIWIIIAIIIGAIWGASSSNDGERSAGAFSGAIMGGMGCGYILPKYSYLVQGLYLCCGYLVNYLDKLIITLLDNGKD